MWTTRRRTHEGGDTPLLDLRVAFGGRTASSPTEPCHIFAKELNMPKQGRLLLAGLTSALLMAIAISAASANRLATNEQQVRLIFSPMVFTGEGIEPPVRCPVTLEKSFHSKTIAKVLESLIGYVTKVTVGTCTGGTARANTETLPWHIRYGGFTGTLPNIVTLLGKSIRTSFTIAARAIPVPCRYTPSSVTGTTNVGAGGRVTGLTITGRGIASETFGCPRGSLEGTASVTTGSGGTVTVTLVA
jgi:hypothetical protein